MSNDGVAQLLFLSEAIVKTHVSRILSKLQLDYRVQAGCYFARLITEPSNGGGMCPVPAVSVMFFAEYMTYRPCPET